MKTKITHIGTINTWSPAKKEFIKKVAIFPFDFVGEENYKYLKYGIPFGCCVSLLQDPLVEIDFPNEFELDGENFINKFWYVFSIQLSIV